MLSDASMARHCLLSYLFQSSFRRFLTCMLMDFTGELAGHLCLDVARDVSAACLVFGTHSWMVL